MYNNKYVYHKYKWKLKIEPKKNHPTQTNNENIFNKKQPKYLFHAPHSWKNVKILNFSHIIMYMYKVTYTYIQHATLDPVSMNVNVTIHSHKINNDTQRYQQKDILFKHCSINYNLI